MIRVQLQDGTGDKREARITSSNALLVASTTSDVPPVGTPNKFRYFNSLLGSTGADSGITNMNVDGSVTKQVFCINSSPDYDIHIMGIVIVIADTAVVHNKFGNIAALTNGWDLKFYEQGEPTNIMNAAKTGGEVIAQSGFGHAFGNGGVSFELSNWTGTTDAQGIYLDLANIIPDGLRIGRGTTDRIDSGINDNLTGLTEFTVRALGYRHYP